MLEPEVFRKQMHRIEESTYDIVGTFGAACSHSAPGELCPLAPHSYSPERDTKLIFILNFMTLRLNATRLHAYEFFDTWFALSKPSRIYIAM